MKRIGRERRKSRAKFTKSRRDKGKISVTSFFQHFEPGEKVKLVVEPSYQKGMYCARFMGKTGVIRERKGGCYTVAVMDFNKQKELLVHPVHLKRLKK